MSAVPAGAFQRMSQWVTDDYAYVRDVFGAEPDPWQVEALGKLFHGKRRTSIAACNGPGKTALAAWATFKAFLIYQPLLMRATAPSKDQGQDIFFTELKRWHQKMPVELRECFRITSDKIEWVPSPISFGTVRTARSDNPEALQGVHNDDGFVLFVIEEATGIADAVFETVGGGLTGENVFVLMIMNPTRTSGFAYDSQHDNRDLWDVINVDHTMSPRVSDDYVQEIGRTYGFDSNVFRARCLGKWPKEESDQLISLDWVTSANGREMEGHGPVIWGLDVARMGDDRSALAKRQGSTLLEPLVSWRETETTELAEIIVDIYDNTPNHLRPTRVCVDDIGVGGGVTDRLKQLLPRGVVLGVNVAETPSAGDKYVRKRDELWWRMREWFRDRSCSIPTDDDLVAELVSVKYRQMDGTNKIKVESKQEMKKRLARGRDLGKSPDLADALMLTFAFRPSISREDRPDGPRKRVLTRDERKRRHAVRPGRIQVA